MSTVMEHWLPRHRLTVDEYHRMAEVGLLTPDARVELIQGEVIDMAPIGVPHGAACDWLNEQLVMATLGQAIVRNQGPVRLGRWTEPVPDFALLAPREDRYAQSHPGAVETLLIIEVSDSTLGYDRNIKVPLYARHGVGEVWIVDVANRAMHFFRSRTDAGYADVLSTDEPGQTPLPLPGGVTVNLAGLLHL